MQSIGFVGLGVMGSVMAPLIPKAGFSVICFDKEACISESENVRMASSLSDLAKCEMIVLMLPDGDVVTSVVKNLVDYCFAGLFIDMSSSHPATTLALSEYLTSRPGRLIDAPVSGGQKRAALGSLTIMVGGNSNDIAEAKPLLTCFGDVSRVGPIGAGHAMKALNNYVSAAGLLSAMQALATAESFGITPQTFLSVINVSTGKNNSTEVKFEPFVIPRQYNSGFALSLMAKDVHIASELIEKAGFSTPSTRALALYLDQASVELGSKADHTKLYEIINPAAKLK